MPPLMGAAIFIMADFTGISYFDIVKASFIPASLFVLSILLVADSYARRHGIRGLPRHELGDPLHLVRNYWAFAVPIVLLVYLLASGHSPDYAVFVGLPVVVLAAQVSGETRLSFQRWLGILAAGARRSLAVGGIAGALGIVVGLVMMTGIAVKLSQIVVDLSGGHVLVAILLTAVVTFFLGMGVSSVTADYLLLSILIAPTLIQLGVPVMAAHLLIIWYTQTSNLTPPVCTVAFAGAAIAEAHPWRTGFFAFRIGLFVYIIPLTFVFGDLLNLAAPDLLMRSAVTAALSAVCFAGVITGYLLGMLAPWQRVLLALAMFGLLEPGLFLDIAGTLVLAAMLGLQMLRRKAGDRARAEAAAAGARPGD
jgi:TRAP transporter 4TM/12TM fusion protein